MTSDRRLPASEYCHNMLRKRIEKAKQLDPQFPWHHRGYLPHFDGKNLVQFITFRLAESIPRTFLSELKLKLKRNQLSEVEYHREVERLLDRGFGPTFLKQPETALIVIENLLKFDGIKYELLHWVIMPTHVHILLKQNSEYSISSILHSMKSYTATAANKVLGRSGAFWSVEYFDRYIRNEEHYERSVRYIHRNPVKAGLCQVAEEWEFGCARFHE